MAGTLFGLGPLYGILWLGLGVFTDFISEAEAEKNHEPYDTRLQACAYTLGPLIVVPALLFGIFKVLFTRN